MGPKGMPVAQFPFDVTAGVAVILGDTFSVPHHRNCLAERFFQLSIFLTTVPSFFQMQPDGTTPRTQLVG